MPKIMEYIYFNLPFLICDLTMMNQVFEVFSPYFDLEMLDLIASFFVSTLEHLQI
jgi:hypothetical protein